MIQTSVRDNSNAIRMGNYNAENAVRGFNQGLVDASKGFEKGLIISRLKDEEDEAVKQRKMQKAIDDGDEASLRQLMQDPWYKKAWNAIRGNGYNSDFEVEENAVKAKNAKAKQDYNDTVNRFQVVADSNEGEARDKAMKELYDLYGGMPSKIIEDNPGYDYAKMASMIMPDSYKPDTIYEPEEESYDLLGKARQRTDAYENRIPTTVARAAETAGIDTGYIPPSEKDRMDIEQRNKDAENTISDFKNNLMTMRIYDGRISEMMTSPGDRDDAWQREVNYLTSRSEELAVRNKAIMERGINEFGIHPSRFADLQSQRSDVVNIGDDELKSIIATMGKMNLPKDKKLSENAIMSMNPDLSSSQAKAIKKMHDDNVDAEHGNVTQAQARKAGDLDLASKYNNLTSSQADVKAKATEARTTLAEINRIPSTDYRQKNQWLKGAVDSGIGRVYGLNTNAIFEMFGLDTFNASQKQFIDSQLNILKSKLGEQAKAAGKIDRSKEF